ncbi:MAG: TetR/AcrR family transcriptional regulator, partial [Myxococcota bacterium]
MQGRALTEAELASERERLAALALHIVETEGQDACSLRRVAADAGISRSTPYSYFADKEALIDAVPGLTDVVIDGVTTLVPGEPASATASI